MACLFLSRSHLNGSVSLDIICCVCSLFWACTDGRFAWPSFPEVSSASDQMFILPLLRLCSALFFSFLTLETNLLQTLSSRLKLCSLPSSDTHPANISAVNCAEPSPWQLLPFLLPVPPNILYSGLCIPRHKMEVSPTLPQPTAPQLEEHLMKSQCEGWCPAGNSLSYCQISVEGCKDQLPID